MVYVSEQTIVADAPPPAPRGRDRTGRDMLLALGCLLLPMLVIGGVLRALGSSDPTLIDPAPHVATARSADVFPVLAPAGLPDVWRPVQASFRRTDGGTIGTLRLGYLAPSGGQVLLVESNEDGGALLERELGSEVRPQGELIVNGRSWTRSLVRGDEQALVLAADGRTIIIVGRAPVEELTALAESLR